MHRFLHHLSLVTTTVLLSLSTTIKLPENSINWTISAQAQTTQEQQNEAVRLNEVGLEQLKTGKVREALQTFEQALSIFKVIKDRKSEGAVLNNIGKVYRNLGRYSEALKYYQEALMIRQEIGDKAGEGITLNSIGLTYLNLGRFSEALKYYEQSLVIAKEVGDKTAEATILDNIGGVYLNLGQYSQALKYREQSLVISQEIGDKAGVGTTLNNLGAIYRYLGQSPQALKYYEQALPIIREVGNKTVEATILNNLGELYNKSRQHTQALKYYEQSLVIAKEIGNKASVGTTLNNLGTTYNYLGQYPEALKYYQQALVIHKEIGNKSIEGTILNNIGNVYDNLGQYSEALKYYEQSLTISKAVGDNAGVGGTLNNIGLVYIHLKKYPDAEKTLLTAIEVLESLRPGLTDASKIAIFETQAQTYRFLQQTLVAQNKANNALEIAERGRARAFVELLASRQSSNPNLQIAIKSLDIEKIKQVAKTQNAIIVEYSIVKDTFKNQDKEEWRDSSLYIWVVKPTGEVAFKQADLTALKTPLAELVTNSRAAIGVRSRGALITVRPTPETQITAKQRLQQLHQILIEPIAQYLPKDPNSRVIFIPQESLFLVPFAALQDQQGKYLIEKHTILTAPAIQVLELTHQARQKVSGKGVLVMGNPTMPSLPDKTGQLYQLPSLPGAETEAKAIAQLLQTTAITGNDATKANILQQLKSARIAHLATHGLLDDFQASGVPGAIALAPSGSDSGLLTSSEILKLTLNTQLVVLSACDTGRGDIKGDGVIGLSRALIIAGVPSILVSLWAVPDAPTADLMTEFYRQLQQNPEQAKALRNAMLTTMKQHPNPRDWAAFTLIGEAE
jgi:CHAT domain-containing protein/Tfp pilus assembly protein PilF